MEPREGGDTSDIIGRHSMILLNNLRVETNGPTWAAGSGGVQLLLKEVWQPAEHCERVIGGIYTINLWVSGVETILCVELRWEFARMDKRLSHKHPSVG